MNSNERRLLFQAGQHTVLAHRVLLHVLRTVKPDDRALHELADAVTLSNLATVAVTQALYLSIPGEPPLDTLARAPRPKEGTP